MRRLLPIALLFSLVLLIRPAPALAQEGLYVVGSSATVDFPSSITFALEVQSQDNIRKIELRYWVVMESCTEARSKVSPQFDVGRRVKATWSWDMKKSGGLPPGAVVRYQWVIEDEAGRRLETSETQVEFEDRRYTWRKLAQENLTLFWYRGDDSFASSLMDAAQRALAKLEEDTGATLKKQVKIYVYASSEVLRGALIYPQEWTGGVAFSGSGIIALGIGVGELEWGRRAIAHELAHLVVGQMTFNCFVDLPTWLNEGLAMYAEGPMERKDRLLLEEAVARNTLISVRSLSSSFPASAQEAQLAYAESYSLVDYLVQTYGRDRMAELLRGFREGKAYDESLGGAYGFDSDGLNSLWRAWLGAKPAPAPVGPTPPARGQPIPTFVPYGSYPTPPLSEMAAPTPSPTPLLTPTPPPGLEPSPTPTPAKAKPSLGCAARFSDGASGSPGASASWPLADLGVLLFFLSGGIIIMFRARSSKG